MHIMPRGTPRGGQCDSLYTRETSHTGAALWRVKMEVDGLLWWPVWTGYAFDSQRATDSAIAWFQGINGPVNVTVKDVFQVVA
jgi:hypothetical protein